MAIELDFLAYPLNTSRVRCQFILYSGIAIFSAFLPKNDVGCSSLVTFYVAIACTYCLKEEGECNVGK